MKLITELELLRSHFISGDETAFAALLDDINARYASPEEKAEIEKCVESLYAYTEELVNELSAKAQIAEISDYINLSAVARNYFNKSKDWLYQRINGNVVNGHRAQFTPDEIEVFNSAIQDISGKLGSFRLR